MFLNMINFFSFRFSFLVRNFYCYELSVIGIRVCILNFIDAISFAEVSPLTNISGAMVCALITVFS